MRLGFNGSRAEYRATHKCPWKGIYEISYSLIGYKKMRFYSSRLCLANSADEGTTEQTILELIPKLVAAEAVAPPQYEAHLACP